MGSRDREARDIWILRSVDFMIGLTIVVASCKEDSCETIAPLFCFTVKSHSCLFVYVLNTLSSDSICLFFFVIIDLLDIK